MPSTYTQLLRIEKPATGEQQGTWGGTANTSYDLLEDAITGGTSIVTSGGGTTLTENDGASDQSRRLFLTITGTLLTNANVIIPNLRKNYIVNNLTTGNFVVSVKTVIGVGMPIPPGCRCELFCDGSDSIFSLDGAHVGDIKQHYATAAPPGWVNVTGAFTIGNGASGATYAGEQYRWLYEKVKPGSESFDAGTPISLPDYSDRVPIGTGTKALGSAGGSASVTPTGNVGGRVLSAGQLPIITPVFTGNAVLPHTHNLLRAGGSASPSQQVLFGVLSGIKQGTGSNVAGNAFLSIQSGGGHTPTGSISSFGNNESHDHPPGTLSVDVEQPWRAHLFVMKY